MALNDRLKLRSMVVGEKDDTVYIASEECAIRVIEPDAGRACGRPRAASRSSLDAEERREPIMAIDFLYPEYEVVRNNDRCIACRVCERQCANEVHCYDADDGRDDRRTSRKCVNCHRCVCAVPDACAENRKDRPHVHVRTPTGQARRSPRYTARQARAACCCPRWATRSRIPSTGIRCSSTLRRLPTPSIDPLREPMETKVFLGKKAGRD